MNAQFSIPRLPPSVKCVDRKPSFELEESGRWSCRPGFLWRCSVILLFVRSNATLLFHGFLKPGKHANNDPTLHQSGIHWKQFVWNLEATCFCSWWLEWHWTRSITVWDSMHRWHTFWLASSKNAVSCTQPYLASDHGRDIVGSKKACNSKIRQQQSEVVWKKNDPSVIRWVNASFERLLLTSQWKQTTTILSNNCTDTHIFYQSAQHPPRAQLIVKSAWVHYQ